MFSSCVCLSVSRRCEEKRKRRRANLELQPETVACLWLAACLHGKVVCSAIMFAPRPDVKLWHLTLFFAAGKVTASSSSTGIQNVECVLLNKFHCTKTRHILCKLKSGRTVSGKHAFSKWLPFADTPSAIDPTECSRWTKNVNEERKKVLLYSQVKEPIGGWTCQDKRMSSYTPT